MSPQNWLKNTKANLSKNLIDSCGLASRTMTTISSAQDRTNAGDFCKTKYDLKSINYTTSTTSGIYTLSIDIKMAKNSDVTENMKMTVEFVNCKGETQAVKLKLTYDARTGTYNEGQAISQNKDCPWYFNYAEIAACNLCKDKTVWSVTHDQRKGNGSGTENASSQTSTRPRLF